ncbi:YafY family protein [Maridesulfovibrio ferrireducens]|uniref:helix-turn-helix transcriptional regulator n=1 Tax=Maridesulfovibrio ferrireducens TaxID=246191 RepID=UPI001A2233C7|nr:WYL domain-containing protein [Maridesulfovibrio ferrireducens]MBI9113372.1 WYL domain-containing protein [Maridesulfovibrio ferrireducens]
MFFKLYREGKKHFKQDLAEEFDCRPSTIQRLANEIERFAGSHFKTGLKNRRRYYSILTFSSQSSYGLDLEQIRSLTLCKQLASASLPDHILGGIEETIKNVSLQLCSQDFPNRSAGQDLPLYFSSKGYIDYSEHHETIDKILKASQKKLVCLIDYKKGRFEELQQIFFAPGRITSQSNALYAIGHKTTTGEPEKGDPRNLAVHRIKEVTLTDKIFDFDAADQEINYFGLKHHDLKKFRIHFSRSVSDFVMERIWSSEQNIEEQEDGTVILEIGTVSENELMAWVRGFGEEATILT